MKLKKLTKTEVDLEPLHEYNRALAGDVIWRSRDGRLTKVKDMETRHLMNTIQMLKGESPVGSTYRCDDLTRRNWIEIMTLEAQRRGHLLAE